MKKVVRDFKRGVNKKVLKVSGIERKVLDATSSEPWGPNGTSLLDIANATRNHQDYQVIMAVIWRRISDTGKKWRHVYKALQVLEYLVAHGSERVIDDILEHGYQISSLAEFQYIDSSGRDQGINVRKKSQLLVALVNDKEKIQEVRTKAQSNKDKGSYAESVYSGSDYGDDGNYKSRSGHNRDYESYGRDAAYHDDSYRGQGSSNNNNNQFSARSPSADGYADRYGDDDRLSSQSGGGRTDDQSPDNRGHDHSFEAHNNMDALPSYEEVIKNSQDNTQDDSIKENVVDPKENLSANAVAGESEASQNNIVDNFDEFDPRGSASAAQPTASSQELDIFGFSASDSNDALALVPANSAASQSDTTTSFFGADFFGAPSTKQADENPFGDAPFKAIPQENVQETSFQQSSSVDASQKAEPFSNFDFGDAFGASAFVPNTTNVNNQQHSSSLTPSFSTPAFPVDSSSNDILDSILPRTGSAPMFSSQGSPFESTSLDLDSAQMNPFQLSDMTNAQSEQMNPFQIPTNETNPFQNFGFSASAAQESQEPAKDNMHAYQMNSFHSSKPLASHRSLPTNTEVSQIAPEVSKGLPTDSQSSSQLDFFQSLGHSASQAPIKNHPQNEVASVPEDGKGSLINDMQSSSQMNFFESSPSASLDKNANAQVQPNNTQASEMNFFEQSVASTQATLQEPSNNTWTSSPSNIQPSQMNFFESPKESQNASQDVQTNDAETAQDTNLQIVQTNNTQQPPQTNSVQSPPQTNNNLQSPPQTNNNMHSPLHANNMQQPPQGNNFQMPPQGNNFLPAPQGNNFLPAPHGNNFQQAPQENNFQQAPQGNNFQQAPQGNNFLPAPQGNNFQQAPQSNNNFLQAPHGSNFQQPSQGNNFLQAPQGNNFRQAPQENSFQQAPQGNNFLQPPQENSFQQASQGNSFRQAPQANSFQQAPQTSNMQQQPQMGNMQHTSQTSNMQTPQLNYFQQRPQYGMPTSQMNFYQQSSSGSTPNMQMGQMNHRPFAQGPQNYMQAGQHNFGPPGQASQSQGMQAHQQTNQSSFVQPMSSSQTVQTAVSSNVQAPNAGTQADVQQMGQTMQSDPFASQAARPQVQKGKFEPKSIVWADTLSRGLVNLDISGAKTNPLAGIGVDFDAINRKDKRLEPKSSGPPPTSTIVMGKAMGSGSGIGRSAASSIAPPPNPMMGPNNMGMGGMGPMGPMGMGMRGPPGMGMGGYGGNMNQAPMGMNMGMMNMGMMGQNGPIQPPNQGMQQGGGYNPVMGMGGYNPQHRPPYGGGGGYR